MWQPKWTTTGNELVTSKRRPFIIGLAAFLVFAFTIVLYPRLDYGAANHRTSRPSTKLPEPEEDHFVLSGPTPQTGEKSAYKDRLIALGPSDLVPQNTVNNLKYAIFLPTYTKHIPLAVDFLRSLKCLGSDFTDITIHVIVSDTAEAKQFDDAIKAMEPCGATFGRWRTPEANLAGPTPTLNVVNLYDVMPDRFKNGVSADNTSALLEEIGRYSYQTMKKLLPAMLFDYDFGLWLDSEATVVQPFSLRQMFDEYVKRPTIWRSRMAKNDIMRGFMGNATKVLGRSIDSWGPMFWNLDSVQWIVEKAVILDMVDYVQAAHDTDFWTAWITNGGPFEVNMYNLHVQARKLETVDSIFSKYLVLETERELIRFGMAPAFPHVEAHGDTGFLERAYRLLKSNELQLNFSAFMRHYKQRLFRFEGLDFAPPEVIDKFLLEAPVDLLVCGSPALHKWWQKRVEEGKLSIT